MSELQNVFASIASAIRAKNDKSEAFTPAQMINEIYGLDKVLWEYSGSESIVNLDNIDSNATILGNRVFYGRKEDLIGVYGENVKYILDQTFQNCYSLSFISFPNVEYVGAHFCSPISGLKNAYIPKCKKIDDYAFYQNYIGSSTGLYSIYLPECVYIGDSAFYGNCQLSQITIPKCEYIGNSAFYKCNISEIETLMIKHLGSYAFQSCSNLNLQSVIFNNCEYIGRSPFAYNTTITEATENMFPKLTEKHEIGGFGCCSNITTISSPNCTKILEYAFESCGNLTDIYFPSCSLIGHHAFANCAFQSNIIFPECISIGSGAFGSCALNDNFVSFNKCEYIGSYAFGTCTGINLSSFYFPKCKYIGDEAFAKSRHIYGEITFPECISVGGSVFGNIMTYGSIMSLHFPKLESIGSCAFAGIRNANIYLPKCNYIGDSAFEYVIDSTAHLYLLGDIIPSLGSKVFSDRYNSMSIFVPSSLYNDYIQHSQWSSMSYRIASYTE